ncbi:MAG: hypothetical protein U0703_21860 [Anaerolineae bacterium]
MGIIQHQFAIDGVSGDQRNRQKRREARHHSLDIRALFVVRLEAATSIDRG